MSNSGRGQGCSGGRRSADSDRTARLCSRWGVVAKMALYGLGQEPGQVLTSNAGESRQACPPQNAGAVPAEQSTRQATPAPGRALADQSLLFPRQLHDAIPTAGNARRQELLAACDVQLRCDVLGGPCPHILKVTKGLLYGPLPEQRQPLGERA